MKKIIVRFIACMFVAGATSLASCSGDNDISNDLEPLDISLTRSENQVMKAVNNFTFGFMRHIDEEKREKGETPNFILSPQGAAWCLAMMSNGVEPGSKSEKELIDFFGFENGESIQDLNEYSEKLINALTSSKTAGSIHIANAVFYRKDISVNKDFLQTLKEFYNTKEFPDFTNSQIDKWVSDKTSGNIKNYGTNNKLEECDFGVLNAIDFNGKWLSPFDPKKTQPREFRNEDGSISTPETMSESRSAYLKSDEICHSLKMSLKRGVFSIHFVIPSEGHSITDIIEHLDGNVWDNISNYDSPSSTYVVRLPKFELKENVDLFEVAKKMGLKSFITDNDLKRICDNDNNILLRRFQQSSSLELAETGVKVTTATDLSGVCGSFMPESQAFFLDEPFLFFITEESTGAILFAGKIGKL